MEDVYAYLQGMAAGLSSSLMTAGARRVRDEALGDEQKRALDRVFAGATAAVLVEVARHDRGDRDLPERLEAEFGKFYRDPWVAETLVRFAISAEEPPLGGLRERYAAVGNDPGELPMDFGQAMRLLVYEIADRARKEASRAGSPLANLVLFPELGIIRAGVEEIARELRRAREAETGAGEEAGGRDGRFEGYERGPDGAEHRVLFGGFFLPSGPEGRFTRGGASRAREGRFLEILRASLDGHRLNSSGIRIEGADLPVDVLDYRPPSGYAQTRDHGGFSELAARLSERSLGMVWGTVGEGGGLQTLEVAVNPDRFYGGPLAPGGFSGVKRLADREDLPTGSRIPFAARALAAMWAQSFCAGLDQGGMHAEAYRVASDSRRLIERALDDLGRELGPGETAAVEEQRRGLLPGIVRQEASSLWRRGEERQALDRLADALLVWPYGPLSGPGEFREFCESHHAFGFARRFESFERFVEENYEDATRPARKNLVRQYARRALEGLPPVDFELFVGWIARAIGRGVDVEDDAERWFAGLVDAHPDAPFVVAYWGEARRRIAIQKYGAGFGSPTARRMDRAAEKFEEAHRMAPKIPYFAARVQGIRFTAATALARTDEGDRRIAEAMEWWEKAVLYYREHAPWALEPGPLDDPEPLARWAGESVRENGRAEGGT